LRHVQHIYRVSVQANCTSTVLITLSNGCHQKRKRNQKKNNFLSHPNRLFVQCTEHVYVHVCVYMNKVYISHFWMNVVNKKRWWIHLLPTLNLYLYSPQLLNHLNRKNRKKESEIPFFRCCCFQVKAYTDDCVYRSKGESRTEAVGLQLFI
jgi:hypothetical protein